MYPISFKANYLTSVNVSRINEDKSVDKEKVALVELDKNNTDDINALHNVARDWEKKSFTFAMEIYNDAVKGYEYEDVNKEHYYALTTQKNEFENLDQEKILGLMMFSEYKNGKNRIDWLQVEPTSSSRSKVTKKYKGIGSALVDYSKQISTNKIIDVSAYKDAIGFYEKQGFSHIPCESDYCMYYEA